MNIAVFGAGYVGLTTAACLAQVGHSIVCIDVDVARIKLLEEGKMPFFEPGLPELIQQNKKKGRIQFTTDALSAVAFAEVFFNCVATPSAVDGSANLQYVFAVAETVAQHLKNMKSPSYKVLVNKSTVPPGTTRKTAEIMARHCPSSLFDVVANPEFLREGDAVRAFNYPDKIVLGSTSERALTLLRKVYAGRLRTYLPIVETDWETAETIKYANNTFLATKISFINEMANICDRVGADIKIVSLALGLDYRISPRFLNPGVGYGGSCFPKDVKALIATAQQKGYVPRLFQEVDAVNERQKKFLVQKMAQVFSSSLAGKSFAVLGLSFKPKTSDMREAPSIQIISDLLAAGASVRAYDPVALEEAKHIFGEKIAYCDSVETAVQGTSALLIVTEWDEFRSINFAEIGKDMKEKIVFDGRNIYEPELVREEGFAYYGIGRA